MMVIGADEFLVPVAKAMEERKAAEFRIAVGYITGKAVSTANTNMLKVTAWAHPVAMKSGAYANDSKAQELLATAGTKRTGNGDVSITFRHNAGWGTVGEAADRVKDFSFGVHSVFRAATGSIEAKCYYTLSVQYRRSYDDVEMTPLA